MLPSIPRFVTTVAVLLSLSLGVAFAQSSVPALLNYQGRLTDSGGVPVDGVVSAEFLIYSAAGGGVPLWSETYPSLQVTSGLFTALLGSSNPFPESLFVGSDLYLAVALNGEPELTPRQRIVSVAFAQRVGTVDQASGGLITRDVEIDGTLRAGLGSQVSGMQSFAFGNNCSAAGDFSSVGGGLLNNASASFGRIGGGENNLVASPHGVVMGGESNSILSSSTFGTIGGGFSNQTFQPYEFIGGGENNATSGAHAALVGGQFNSAQTGAFLGGGYSNSAHGTYSVVAGGSINLADGANSFIGGGSDNTVSSNAAAAVIAGGFANSATGLHATISGGQSNTSGEDCFVGGGAGNTADLDYSAVAGGLSNTATFGSFVGGGSNNIAQGGGSSVTGGQVNQALAPLATVGGGIANKASGYAAVVAGGEGNIAAGAYSVVCGGGGPTGSDSNFALGTSSVVVGGSRCEALGNFSLAAGRGARAFHTGSFVWADSGSGEFYSLYQNEFAVRAERGLRAEANSPQYGANFRNNGNGDGMRAIGNVSQGNNWGALYAINSGSSPAISALAGSGLAGFFNGDVDVTGSVTKSASFTKSDHPLDPANKYLQQALVESNEMVNIYSGNVVTDGSGYASVALPEYAEALDTDFRYQLTVIGEFAQAIIAERISAGRFLIRTSEPRVEVSWQVTGVRSDPLAQQLGFSSEIEKDSNDRGKYLNPEAYNLPASEAINNPEEKLK